jgi:hypothetical protein
MVLYDISKCRGEQEILFCTGILLILNYKYQTILNFSVNVKLNEKLTFTFFPSSLNLISVIVFVPLWSSKSSWGGGKVSERYIYITIQYKKLTYHQ